MRQFILLLVFIATFSFSINAINAQNTGEVIFVGFNADGNNGFAFVTLVSIANGTNIRFNDNEWGGASFDADADGGVADGSMTWTNNTGSAIPAGTLITVTNSATTPAVTIGTTSGGTIALRNQNEGLYMFIGPDASTPTTFLSAISNETYSAAVGVLTGTGLSIGVNAIEFTGDEDVMVYLNNVNCNSTIASCASSIATTVNWATENDGPANDDTDGTFPDFPSNVCDVAGTLFYPKTTYYSLATGAWDANTSWSLTSDGSSGAVAVGEWPRRTDNVVIKSGHTITINSVDDNKSCGNSPDGLNRANVGQTFSGSTDLMFYHAGDILISTGGTLTSSEEVMFEGYTLIENGATINVNEDIVNLGYLEISTLGIFNNTDDLILSGSSTTIINNTSTGADDIYMDHSNATLCGSGIMNLGNGGADPTVQYLNGATTAQICSTFTITCTSNCGAFSSGPPSGNFFSGIVGPGGVGNANNNKLWLRANTGAFSDNGITPSVDMVTVQRWNDQSGNGNNAIQNVVANRPIYRTGQDNNLPALQFTGNLFIDAPALGIAGTGSLDYIIVFRDTQTGLGGLSDGNGHYILDRTSGTNALMSLKPVTGSFYGFQKRADNGTGLGGPISTTSINTNSKWIEMARVRGVAYRIYYGGSLQNSIADGDGNLTPPQPRIGRHATTASNGLRGFINEFIIYNRAINDAQRIIINNYISAKYNITLATNDVYTMDNIGNGNYDFEVAGIGQAADGSNHRDARGTGVVRMWNPNNLGNSEFLMWGHDNTPITNTTTASPADVDGTIIEERLSRIWRAGETGDVGNVSISFDFSGIGSPLGSNLRLLIDRDGDGFGDNDVTPIVGTVSGGVAVFSNVNLQNGDLFTLGNTDASVSLPIELMSFEVTPFGSAVLVQWTTASELNNDFFSVEKSADAEQWEDVVHVAGAGTSSKTHYYEIADYHPSDGVSYYRLKQTDYDGRYEYSPIVSVNFESFAQLTVSPNPSSGLFTISYIGLRTDQVRVYNSLGQRIPVSLTPNDSGTLLNISDFPSGIYILQVSDGISLRSVRLVKKQ